MGGGLCVEDYEKLNPQRDLFSAGKIKFGGRSCGFWKGHQWEALVSPSGSWLSIGGRKYPLVVHQCEGIGVGVRWVMQDPDTGQRCRWLLLTPDGRVGSRTSLRCRYRSQRIWTRRRQQAHARMRIIAKVWKHTNQV